MHDNNIVDRISQHALFDELVVRRSRLVWSLMFIALGAYFSLVALVALWPALLRAPVVSGATTTVGVAMAVFVIVLGWILTWVYVSQSTGTLDTINSALLNEVAQ